MPNGAFIRRLSSEHVVYCADFIGQPLSVQSACICRTVGGTAAHQVLAALGSCLTQKRFHPQTGCVSGAVLKSLGFLAQVTVHIQVLRTLLVEASPGSHVLSDACVVSRGRSEFES